MTAEQGEAAVLAGAALFIAAVIVVGCALGGRVTRAAESCAARGGILLCDQATGCRCAL